MTKVIIDCDPGHDDALAILLAAKHLEVIGITTVGGNQDLEKVTANAEVGLKLDTPRFFDLLVDTLALYP